MDGLPPGTSACPGHQCVLIPTIDPKDEVDFSAFTTCDKPVLSEAEIACDHGR